jgi:nucleotide-binding universal stress UspA family protein
MDVNRKILIAVDDSEVSHQAVDYVAEMIGGRHGFHVCLFHVLPPFPPSLLEHGGSENPNVEEEIEARIRNKQDDWLEKAKRESQPMMDRAKAILHDARVPARAIKSRFYAPISGENLVSDILLQAQTDACDTIVVGRETFAGLQRVFRHHVADDLIRRGHNHTIWVVE